MKKGITRMVFLVSRNYVIKIPNFRNGHINFLQGCLANWKERDFCKFFGAADFEENLYPWVAPSYFCSWFGLLQIQQRCKPMDRELLVEEKLFFKPLCYRDNKKDNFGILNDKVVCLDYA